jgi:hypothetical protein
MYFSVLSVLPSLRFKYSAQHPVLKYVQCREIGLCEIKRKVPTLVSALLDCPSVGNVREKYAHSRSRCLV